MMWRILAFLPIMLAIDAMPARAEGDAAANLYGGMKRTAIAMLSATEHPATLLVERDVDGAPEPVDLFSCGDEMADVGLGKGDSFNTAIATAIWGFRLANLLRDAGLGGIADEGIATIERDEIEHVRAETQKTVYDQEAATARRRMVLNVMAARLNQAVLARGLTGFANPAFAVKGDCGTKEPAYKLTPSDSRVQLYVIKEFYYATCQALGIDPVDRQRCSGWQPSGGDLSGASKYRYVADFPDGRRVSDTYAVTDAALDNSLETPKVLVVPLSKP